MDVTHVYAADIAKTSRRDDGTLEFEASKATGPDLDSDRQILDPEWLKAAMPEWFTWGNLREQHSAIAAGKGTSLEERGDGWYVAGVVVDPGSVAKVEAGVLKGLSVGIKGPRIVKDAAAPGGRIVDGHIVEVSLVDRPANETCKLVLAKAAGADNPALAKVEELSEANAANAAPSIAEAIRSALTDDVRARARQIVDASPEDLRKAIDPGRKAQIVAARDALAALLLGEAEDLAGGQEDEAYDIQCLLDALSALRWFEIEEAYEETEDDMNLSTVADLVKAATADDATDETKSNLSELRKALGLDALDGIVTDIEATKAAAGRVDALEGRLAEVEKMAAPGGPVRAPTAEDRAKAHKADRRDQADHFRRLADSIADRELAAAYRTKAAELDAVA